MSEDQASKPGGDADEGRRAFLKLGTVALGGGLATIVVAPALKAVLWPLREDVEVTAGGDEFVVVGRLTDYGEVPVKVDIYADRVDAWNRTKDVKIGSAWVVQRDGELRAFSTVCPHLGCAIDYDEGKNKFKCPCHDSLFGLDGSIEEGPSPRPMDALEHQPQGEGELLAIRYERYKQGVEQKVKV